MHVTRVSDGHATASAHASGAPCIPMNESQQTVTRFRTTSPDGRKRMIHRICVSFACLGLALSTFVSQAQAQFFGDSSGSASLSDYAVQDDFGGAFQFGNDGGTYLLFQKMIGNGTGFTASYQRFGLRMKLVDTGDSHLWSEGHVIITDESRMGFNLGGGYRWLIDGNVLGVHGWYDNFQTDLNNRYTQTTFGVELLHEDVDIRANAYIPFGDDENFVAIADEGSVPIFDKRRIAFIGTAYEEQAMKGVDAEIGAPILGLEWARAYAGGYYYESQAGDDAPGFRGRVETAISNDLSLNFMVTHDTVFDTNLNLGVEYRFSGGIAPPTLGPFHGASRKYAQVRRQWPIATRIAEVPALYDSINPRTQLPYKVIHVDNTNSEAGDGTFENPFRSLPSTVPGADFVLVQTGVGDTVGNITLDPFTRMLGEGRPFTFIDARRGEFLLPEAFGRTGPAPVLVPTNPMRDLITLADANEVNNFTIRADGQTAIGGMDIDSFHIERINGRAENGINIVNASGRGLIKNFGMPGTPFLLTDTGVFVSNTSGDPLHLVVDGVNTSGGDIGMQILASGGDIQSHIGAVRGDNHMDAGLILGALAGSQHITELSDVFIRSSLNQTDRGIVLDVANDGVMAAKMNLVGADGNGDLLAIDVTDGMLNATINNSFFSNSRTANGVNFNLDNARGRTTFNGLIADRNDVDGLHADATGLLNDYTINVIDSELIANGDDNFDTTVTGGGALRLFVDPTDAILSESGSGFEFEVRDPGSVLIANFLETNLSLNALHAVDGNVQNGAYAYLGMSNSQARDSGANGLNLNVDRDAVFRGVFESSSFSRSGVNGVEVAVSDGSNAELNFLNTPAAQNGANGLLFDVSDGINGGSQLTLNVTNGDFSDNPLANVRGAADGPGSEAVLNFSNTTADNLATAGGLVLNATGGGSIDANWNQGSISNIRNHGVQANAQGPGSNVSLDFEGLTIQGNMGNGVDVSIDGPGATGHANFVDSSIVQNLGDGFEFDVLNGGSLVATASGNGSFNGNRQRAWHGTVDGMGSAASLNLNGTNGDFSELEGGRFDVTGGGLFNLTMFNVNVTGSRFDGLLTNVAGPMSEANFRLESVRLRNNGSSGVGDGFEVVASNGATIYSEMENMLVSANRDNGFRFDTITGATSNGYLMSPNATGNGRAGLRFNTMSGGRSGISVTDGSFSNNGASFPASGVEGLVQGLGTTAHAAFNGTTADMNSRHGLDFLVEDGARLTSKLVTLGATGTAQFVDNGAFGTLSASNNSLSGVRFLARNGGPTHGNLLMEGANQFNNNGDFGVDYDALDIEQGVAIFDGMANNNGLDGVNIRMENVTLGSIAVIGNSAETSGNGGDGFDATVINTKLGPINLGPFNTPTGVVNILPGLSIDRVTAEGNMGHGVVFQGVSSTIVDGEFINNNTNENEGNGLFVMLTDTMADNLHVNTNNTSDNSLNGINVELIRTPIANLEMNDNGTLLTGTQNVGLTFFIDGNTFTQPYSIINSSDPGVDITGFQFDILPSSHLFDTVEPQGSTPFQPQFQTDIVTGLLTVNGTAITPGTDPLQDSVGTVLVGGGVTDGTSLIDLTFDDFNSNETFTWLIDADPLGGTATVLGSDLIGSTVVVDFSSGAQLTGALMAVPGNTDAAIFVATGGTGLGGAVENNGLNGVRLFIDDSDLTNLSMSGNVAQSNGDAGMVIDAINGSDVTTATLMTNELTMNGAGGLVLQFQDSSLTDATISDSNISNNTGDGILFDFTNSPVTNLAIVDNANIDQNSGNGINFQMVNSNVNGLLIDNNGIGTVVPPTPTGAFDITLNLQAGLTPSQIAAFQAAEQRWEEIITGDVPDIGLIDDVLIDASVVAIDGVGGILGQAGPTGLRGGSFLPFQGIMQFDSADLASLELAGQLDEVILHEMGHVLGFGTIWDNLGLLLNPGTADPRFTGAQATTQYNTIFANAEADIPVENIGGPGTADAHWRETIFTNELMTGFLDGGVANPISAVTIAQFADLGYTVDLAQADPFVPLVAPVIGPSIEGTMLRDMEQQVVEFADAQSSGIAALNIGTKGFEALQAIQQNGLNGINISLTNSDLTGGVISNNIIAGHTNGDGVRMVNPSTMGNPIELDFDSNTINGNLGGSGVNLVVSQADLNSNFTDNEIGGNGAEGINIDLSSTAAANLNFTGNTLTANGADGLEVTTAGTATLDSFLVENNTATSNGDDGIELIMSGASSAPTVTINTNTANDNLDNGILVRLTGTAMIGTLTVDGNTATGNTNDGILIETASPNTINDISVSGSPDISGNGGNGIEIVLNNVLGTQNVTVSNNNTMDNLGGGILLSSSSTVLGDVTMDGNMVLNNTGGDGILLQFNNSSAANVFLTNNLIGQAAGDGIGLDLNGSPIANLQINNNQIGMTGVGGGTTGTLDDSLPVIRAGFTQNNLPANDDNSTDAVNLGFDINFFGQMFSQAFVNNNGNITFDAPLFNFTPFNLISNNIPIIAPFFADVDTTVGNIVTFGNETIAGQTAFGVNWPDVRHFFADNMGGGLPTNNFQLVLIDRSDVGAGDFDIEFNYDQILWEAGEASFGNPMGLGGDSARAGFSNGVDQAFELAGSGINGAFLDGGPAGTSLVQNNLNSANNGRYVFFARNGGIGTGAGGSTGDGIHINAANGSHIGNMNIDGNTIEDNGSDGIELVATNSTLPANGSISDNTISNHNGGDAIRIINPDTNNTAFGLTLDNNTLTDNMGGAGINISMGAESGEFTGSITNSTITGNGSDGIILQNSASANAMNVTVTGVDSSANGGRGILVEATNDDGARSTFNIGEIGGDMNTFSDNGAGGVVFRTRATAVDQTQTAANTDVRVDENLENPAVGAYFDVNSRDVVGATMNLLNATISGNGGDGVTLEVGSNTLMNSQLAGLNIGGSTGVDLNISPIVSANPPDSIDSANPNMDVLVFDAVAHLDLALGAADTNNDGTPDVSVATQNKGNGLTVNFTGADFSNTDVFKDDRAVRLVGQVQAQGSLNSPQNTFSTGAFPTLEDLFNSGAPLFNVIPSNMFPDTTVP
ncbi:MAG: right-handed parallel beta-helix repeat-containing protein [Planctomycetaceae bacterium]